ncbi:CIA30 family protein [uncultured Clostridium sp.]|uniref:CIA30 family protein n=1 Tax=uncultured Clostridium sp. TaxID=59620 RepID=UPI0025F64CE2|nr:CIA30 family protein [uncultured Clostridium sp.]MDU4884161.1 CIA30 family protein [Clostridium celatum]MDU7077370.1 CIA30 family protein [Clostridium celatum]
MVSSINKRLIALVMSCTILCTQTTSTIFAQINDNRSVVECYFNDFSKGNIQLPNEVDGVIKKEDVFIQDEMLAFKANFDGEDNWDNNKHDLNFYVDYGNKIKSGSKIIFDMLIPTKDSSFDGLIKFKGVLKDSNWGWNEGLGGELTSNKFEDLGNGYSKVTLESTMQNDIDGIKSIVIPISAYNCTYNSIIYLDNLRVVEEANDDVVIKPIENISWNFDNKEDGVCGWKAGGSWAYDGPINISYENFSLKLEVDYSDNIENGWSEVKIQNNLEKPININGYNILTYDFIYNPNYMSTGSFQTKLSIDGAVDTSASINIENSIEIDGGLRKAKAIVKFKAVDKDIENITIGIVGSNVNYKGDIYIDNITLGVEEARDIYVEKVVDSVKQEKFNIEDLEGLMQEKVRLVDNNATQNTANLFSYLFGIGKTDKVLYGHHNDAHTKAVLKDSGTNSDTKDLTGSLAGIVGIDTTVLAGAEIKLTDEEKESGMTLITKSAKVCKDAAAEGAIISITSHMPNFDVIAKNGKNENGNYDYSIYSSDITAGNVVTRVMPGGDLNDVLIGYLDLIADFANELDKDNIAALFRPLHENNGSWFWWGEEHCDAEAYKNLYAYIVEYLRDYKNVHNFLYVYSPGGPIKTENEYLERYPGDEFVDVLSFDMYHNNPLETIEGDEWVKDFENTIKVISDMASKRGKVSSVAETGILAHSGGLNLEGNLNKKWFQDISNIISKSDMSYYMIWANFGEDSFFAPYMVGENKGHEMINEFIEYYNNDKSIFADGVGNYQDAKVEMGEAYSYGYITSPASGDNILEGVEITGKIKNLSGNIKFVIKGSNDESIVELNAIGEGEVYKAQLTNEVIDMIGSRVCTIELYCNDNLLNSIRVKFNIEEIKQENSLVDDFESYYGENSLLKDEWRGNSGPGCYVNSELISQDGKLNLGNYALAFNYKISNENTSEGWAGITKEITKDWSEYDALKLWIKPDGNEQKLVIQITSNGEDFEVWLPEFATTTEAKFVTLPFTEFKGKNNGVFDASKIERFGIWCNTLVSEGHEGTWTVESTMYFDEIKAVSTADLEEPEEDGDNKPGNGEEEKPTIDEKPEEDNKSDNGEEKPGTNKPNSDKDKLPKTGGIPSVAVGVFGALIGTLGATIIKRKK